MKKLILLPLLLLAACKHVEPVTVKFPQAPDTLLEQCAKLQEASEGMKLSEFTKVVVQNYILYHECSRKVEGWHEWYSKQKDIFENATKK